MTVVTGDGRQQAFLPHGADPATADAASGPINFALFPDEHARALLDVT
ncbi:hypothetical protein ACWDF9_27300 [Streptomyces rubiginosohelvolus]